MLRSKFCSLAIRSRLKTSPIALPPDQLETQLEEDVIAPSPVLKDGLEETPDKAPDATLLLPQYIYIYICKGCVQIIVEEHYGTPE